jgi:LAO/AO transport system kinase
MLESSGELATLRSEQQRSWMWFLIVDRLEQTFRTSPAVVDRLAGVEADVLAGRITPPAAVDALLEAYEARTERTK